MAYHPAVRKVAFVPNKHEILVLPSLCRELVMPAVEVVQGLLRGEVKDKDACVGATIKGRTGGKREKP